ncbi:aspartyl-tRNA(Asn)/glutamyl-tRNA(Gln) amidotransferase subunit C [Arcanobacterium pluranimalium]|uniref:Asp-tRNA(Asn)/Glu-tRNA(Gln) amidotransferase subunit GatC n=1 Tax=Arcanobacterium pluranimalium TaxID=108028 RepID=UPI00195E0430|nr:Asp-tRNA(Asn)/Glu-tRNA(Gln) amidotransferase subunit GatC [Arcanobacterium pluranimalium]MBM7825762.1 aspartyl-tRNA(Asn)/glutamyl-tRNA(Gln) amidotransferase subunit C [Arcanobacterium pluranimalium]
MSSFSKEEVARVADLARIALTDEEIAQFANELAVISDAVAKVSEVASADVPATSHPIPLSNVWREDVVGSAGVDIDEVLAMAPAHEDGKFAVPQILGEE